LNNRQVCIVGKLIPGTILLAHVWGSQTGSRQWSAIRFCNVWAIGYLHFSQWTVRHAHLALLGGFGFMAAGLGLWIVPEVL